MPHLDLFDRVVAENGALLYDPATSEERPLAQPPPQEFVEALQRARRRADLRRARPSSRPGSRTRTTVLEAIRDLGLELQIIFNKGAVMVLPAGVNKATGLRAALDELGLSPHNVVAVGDAENDHAFMQASGFAVAVANALPAVKESADIVTQGARGAGVERADRGRASSATSKTFGESENAAPSRSAGGQDGRRRRSIRTAAAR